MSHKIWRSVAAVSIAAAMFSGCASTGTSNTTDGLIGGAAAGALAGQLIGGNTQSMQPLVLRRVVSLAIVWMNRLII